MAQFPMKGHCLCHAVEYTLNAAPIFVNGCHCRVCQCMSGSAFAVNIMIEASNVQVTSTTQPIEKQEPRPDHDPDEAKSTHCPTCGTLLWATHKDFGDGLVGIRAGTLDESEKIAPGAHFFVRSKHPWITIPEGVPTFEALPGPDDGPLLNAESKARMDAAMKTQK